MSDDSSDTEIGNGNHMNNKHKNMRCTPAKKARKRSHIDEGERVSELFKGQENKTSEPPHVMVTGTTPTLPL